jgi:hypothetical protein
MAAIRMSAWCAISDKPAVFEWQIVTVASRCRSSSAIGLPTMSLRPITTAWRPAIWTRSRVSISMIPEGVQATSFGRF